jgi:hypothetical protein
MAIVLWLKDSRQVQASLYQWIIGQSGKERSTFDDKVIVPIHAAESFLKKTQ